MSLYEPKQLADSMRVVRKNTIVIAEDIPEAQYDYRPTPDSRSVRETLLHLASMTFFDFHIHEEQKRASMEGFDFSAFFAGLPTAEKRSLSKEEIVSALREQGERWCGWVEKLPEARAEEIVTRGGAGPGGKAYASHCTSFAHCGTTMLADTLFENFTPWAFRGGFAPGCSYRQSFLPL